VIASWRGIGVLAVVALALALVVALHRAPGPVERAVVPGFTGDAHSLRWQRAVGDMRIDRVGDHWMMGTRTLDSRAIDAVVSALRGARWHRRADRARAGAIHATLYVDGRAVSIGQSLEGVDQTWLVVDGHALLVDGWVARALEPATLALVDRQPFAAAATAPTIRVGDVELSAGRTHAGIVAPARAQALIDALTDVQFVRLPTHAAAGATVQLGAQTMIVGGACAPDAPQLVAVHAPTGDGCIEPAAWQAVTAAAAALATPDALDPRPAGVTLARVGELDFSKGGLDPDRVAELTSALAQPGELVAVPAGTPRASIEIAPKTGAPITLDVYADAVARRGEARAIRVAPSVLAILARPSRAYADATRWAEDSSEVARLVVDGKTFDRGAVVGEWTGSGDAALVTALAAAVSNVRAPDAPLPAGFRAAHHVSVTFAPPVGAHVTHELELAAPGPDGCAARIDGIAVTAPPALCMAAAAASAR